MNETCDKLIEAVETRRAALIGNLHSIHETEEVRRKQGLSSVDASLVRLSDSIQFTRNLLDSSDDVEMMTVGLQAMEALKGLKKMTWNKESIKPSLLRLAFSPLATRVQSFGKVHNAVLSSDIFTEGIKKEVYINTEMKFTVRLSDEISKRKYDADSLLTVKVTRSDSPRSRPFYATVRKVDMNKWTVSVTPKENGQHTIEIKVGSSASLTHQFHVIRAIKESSASASYTQTTNDTATIAGSGKATSIKAINSVSKSAGGETNPPLSSLLGGTSAKSSGTDLKRKDLSAVAQSKWSRTNEDWGGSSDSNY